MSKIAAGILVVLVVLAGVVGVIAFNQSDEASPTTRNETSNQQTSSSETRRTAEEENKTTNTVDIKNSAFNPATITIKKGVKVTWTNQDTIKHDVAPDKESNDFKGSELLAKGEKYEFIFNKPGTYTYHCTPHPYMKGTVIVTE